MSAAAASLSHVIVRGARVHNLRNLDVDVPRDALVVVTGPSGSGKSSLAFDTIYAEGQRRYVESLSAYARHFLEQMSKPDVESIEGLSPAIAIEQKTVSRSPRSTVGTATEIGDFLRLLYARVGTPQCPGCGNPISSQSVEQMTDRVLALDEGTRVQVLAPIVRGRKGEHKKELEGLRRKGFVHVRVDGEMRDLADDIPLAKGGRHDIDVVVDRLIVKQAARARVADSIETALKLADGLLMVSVVPRNPDAGESRTEPDAEWLFSQRSACVDCGLSLPELTPRLFSFNNPHGACAECGGLGSKSCFDPERIVAEPARSLAKGAIQPWSQPRLSPYYRQLLCSLAEHFEIDMETPWKSLPRRVRDGILFGVAGKEAVRFTFTRRGASETVHREWKGVIEELERRASEDEKAEVALSRYRTPQPCPSCDGSRLRAEARCVSVDGLGIHDLARLSCTELNRRLGSLRLDSTQRIIAERILREIRERLGFLEDVGLGYLSLDRPSATLSGGEGQRIRLATQIGSSLMGVLYILDEPSIGLHARDNQRLLESLLRLRDMGNSVLVVEHDEATVRCADYVIDMGPGAGIHGGQIVSQGPPAALLEDEHSLTGDYLSGRRRIPIPEARRGPADRELVLRACRANNLKNVTLRVPLGRFVVVTGVSGSGKSTLVNDTLHRALAARLYSALEPPGAFDALDGIEHIDKVIDVDQSPIGRSPRSNPVTYTGAFSGIRQLFSQVPEARVRGYGPGRFSFNVKGGRCEACQGDGMLRVEMHFLPDLFVTCEVCSGRRYNRETLEITYKGRNIAEVLEMSVEEALEFMENVASVRRPLQALHDVGLDYIHLGQSATMLSGGEAQRVKLAKELARRGTGRTLYLLDEPTTGLHLADVQKLLELLDRLVEKGNTVIVIEHHLDVIKTADHVIDLGPEGGAEGGEIVVEGTPEFVAACARSHTGVALASVLDR